MADTSVNQQWSLLVPKLKTDINVRAEQPGRWNAQESRAFGDLASSLDYDAPGQIKSVSSVPTMWARPMTMEMAIHDKDHPIHQQMVSQWQGMLAAIALAEVRGFPLKAQLIDLATLRYEMFANALYQLLPEPANTLYRREGRNPWEEIYIFLWKGKPVGMTTPSTLVCPSEEGNWEGLPWWDGQKGLLKGPQQALNPTERELLWRWLEHLQQNLQQYQGSTKAVNNILGLISEFRASLDVNPNQVQPLNLSSDPQFFGEPLNRGALMLLNKPVKAPPKPSNVRLIGSAEKEGNQPKLIVIDEKIADYWGHPTQTIWVHKDKTLASLNVDDLKSGRIIWDDARWIESKDLFLSELYFIDQQDALPGALLPQQREPIAFQGEKITPLLPLNPILLDYFTPEDLIKKITLEPINDLQGSLVRVILDLPLSGMDDQQPYQNYRLYKDYLLREENAIKYLPVLQVWPNLKTEGWKEYYGFYYDAEYGDETFQIYFPKTAGQPKVFQEGRGSYQLARFEEFPEYLVCQNNYRQQVGLIVLPTPLPLKPTGTWKVGVDFGTSFTNIYVNRNQQVNPLPLDNLHLTVTDSSIQTRLPVLFEHFIPEQFLPRDNPLPLCSVLTIKGSPENNNQMRPILDGRIYVPDVKIFEPENDYFKTDLKWLIKNLKFNQIFLRHLALHISALSAKAMIREINWCFSYPSAFSEEDKLTYHKVWSDVTKELIPKTGITHSCPVPTDVEHFQTESLSIAQYFAGYEGHYFVNATCIDLGGGTSDISVWEDNELRYQCSIQFAGRNIFSELLQMNPPFIEQKLLKEEKKSSVNLSWKKLRGGAFNAKLDVILRNESDKWLQDNRIFMQQDEEFQGLIQLLGLSTAGLYYYMGMLLKILGEEGQYNRQEITPVYIGGNGSRFLHWLSPTGQFSEFLDVNKLLSRMLSKGSGFPDTEETTHLSQNPKHEVSCGLVLGRSPLTGLQKHTDVFPIAGEKYEVRYVKDGETKTDVIDSKARLVLQGDVQSFKIPELTNLKQFVYDYHVALRELNIQSVQPVEWYTEEPPTSNTDKNSQLWRDVRRDLDNTLLSIKGDARHIRQEPPFILELKSLLSVLGKKWANKFAAKK